MGFYCKCFRNKATRDAGQSLLLASNTMKIEVPDDVDTSDENAMKTVGYESIKQFDKQF